MQIESGHHELSVYITLRRPKALDFALFFFHNIAINPKGGRPMHQKIRTRKFLRKLLGIGLPIFLCGALVFGGWMLFDHYLLFLDGECYERSITRLDLSGKPVDQLDRITELTALEELDLRGTGISAAEYEKLQAALPDCRILWEPCFQGTYYPLDTESITVTSLTEADVAYLDYFTGLRQVDAMGCQDYAAIFALMERRPECAVTYQVAIGQTQYLKDAEFITVTDADIQTLQDILPYLPKVTGVLFTGSTQALAGIQALRDAFPGIIFDYQIEFHGLILPSNLVELDFSALPLSRAEDIEEILPYLPDVTYVDVTGCAIPHEQMAALSRRWPQIRFAWTVLIADIPVRTDATELDLSGKYIGDVDALDALLPYFPDLTRLEVCDCGIDYAQLDTLNRKYENIQIIWTVQLGDEMKVRTDITTFMPVKYGVWMEEEDTYNLRYCTELIAIDMGHMDIRSIDFVAYMPNLKYLLLCDSQVDDLEPVRGLQKLMYVELFLTHVTDYAPLLDCPALEDLNISWTYGYYEPLTRMTNLKRLWWGGTGHSYYEVQQLTQCLPDTQLVLWDGESTGSGWRKHPHYYEMRDLFGMYYME